MLDRAAWPSGLGKGLQSPVPPFDSGRRLQGMFMEFAPSCSQNSLEGRQAGILASRSLRIQSPGRRIRGRLQGAVATRVNPGAPKPQLNESGKEEVA